jgi:hypothetical protein
VYVDDGFSNINDVVRKINLLRVEENITENNGGSGHTHTHCF